MEGDEDERVCRIENMDRITQLPKPMILGILSRLPLRDISRASILSKSWKYYCSLYPILNFNNISFALRYNKEMNEITILDMFMDDVDKQLASTQLNSPIRRLVLIVEIHDTIYFARVDKWMELMQQINIEDLSIYVGTESYYSLPNIKVEDLPKLYEIPFSVLALKGLRSLFVQWCKLGCDTGDDPVTRFCSLQQLHLSDVFMDRHVLDSLIRFCQGIEDLVLNDCIVEVEILELSKFRKLKKAFIGINYPEFEYVDIVDTNLECIECHSDSQMELYINPAACASIRKLVCMSCTIRQADLLKDLTSTFPILEEGVFELNDIASIKAASNALRKLTLGGYPFNVKEVYIDCPGLTLLDCQTNGVEDLYVNCPKLRDFKYNGTTLPDRVFCGSMPHLEWSSISILGDEAYDTLWLIKLRKFLILFNGNTTCVSSSFKSPMATMVRDEVVEAVDYSPRHNIHLRLQNHSRNVENGTALVDDLLWIIRPAELTLWCGAYEVVKYLCEILFMKAEVPCWMQVLEDFGVECECSLDVSITKDNVAAFLEQCPTLFGFTEFKFQWSSK